MEAEYYCRVCGYFSGDELWSEDGPNYMICPCCGVESGYEDTFVLSIKKYRERWLQNGCKWFILKDKPENWNLEEQLGNIPKQFR